MTEKHVFHFLVDDAHGDYFFKILLEEPEVMPTVKKYIFDNGAYSKNCLASYVASSIPGHTVHLTGVFPNRNGIPYVWFWDVSGKLPKLFDFSKIKLSTIRKWNKALSKDIKTVFEHIPDSVSFTVVSRGAKYKFLTLRKLIYAYILLKLKGGKLLDGELGLWEYIFINQMKNYLKKVQKKGIPTYLHIIYPPSDMAAHEHGFESENYRKSLKLFDRLVKLLIEGDPTEEPPIPGLKDLGILENCMFVVCSDHSSAKFDKLYDILANVRKLPLKVISTNEPKMKKRDLKEADILVAPGAGIHIFYVRKPNTRDFSQPIGLEVLRSYPGEESRESIDLLETLLAGEGVARVYIRIKENMIAVVEPKGSKGTIKKRGENHNYEYSYEIEGDIDPLKYKDDPRAAVLTDGKFHKASEWFKNTYHAQYPFQVDQIFRYMDEKRVGNVIVEAKKGWNFVAPGLEDADQKVQNHDTCDRDEIVVPVIISGQNIKNVEIPYCRNVDIIPTVLEWLGLEYDQSLLDGRPLKEIFE